MGVHAYICMFICMYVYVYTDIYIYMYTYMVGLQIKWYGSACISIYIHIHVHTWISQQQVKYMCAHASSIWVYKTNKWLSEFDQCFISKQKSAYPRVLPILTASCLHNAFESYFFHFWVLHVLRYASLHTGCDVEYNNIQLYTYIHTYIYACVKTTIQLYFSKSSCASCSETIGTQIQRSLDNHIYCVSLCV